MYHKAVIKQCTLKLCLLGLRILLKYNQYTLQDSEVMSIFMVNPLILSTKHIEYILKIYSC